MFHVDRRRRSVSPDQLVGRGLKPQRFQRLKQVIAVSPDQLVGRGLKQRCHPPLAIGQKVSPDQLVGRGLKLSLMPLKDGSAAYRPINWSGAD